MEVNEIAPRVLAVEESHQIRRLIRVNLEADGLVVCEAQSHDECIKVAQAQKCQLLLFSLDVPDVEASRTVREIRGKEGWALPVLLITLETPTRALLRDLEPVGYLRKPFDATELAECVRDLLRGHVCPDPVERFCV